MKKRYLISICVVSVLLLSGFPAVALAGFEPSPFIGQLGAVENILNSANDRVVKTMEYPPDPCVPSHNLNGALNRLEAINSQLGSVGDMIFSIIDEVMGFEPMPFIPAFTAVRDAAQGIVESIKANPLPVGEVPDEFINAIGEIESSAQDIVQTADGYINFDCLGTSASCDSLTTGEECEYQAGCAWIYHIGGDGTPGYFICNGTATTCSDLFDPKNCDAQIGCYYEE